MDHSALDQLIDLLESEAEEIEPLRTRWKPLWNSIRTIGAAFRETRYPTREEKDQAWHRFQSLVERVKQEQNSERTQRENLENTSDRWKDEIMVLASEATPPSSFEESVYAVTFGIVETAVKGAVNALLPGPEIDETKDMLLHCSGKLREGWNLLSEHKVEMLGRHKKEAFDALSDAQAKLDAAWERWREAKGRAWEAFREQKRQGREAFEDRVRANIEKLQERLDKLSGVLHHKESHLDELRDKQASAWSDDFRDRVGGWIDEEESAIQDIGAKIDQIEEWLEEERSKLR
ncbi:MAG: hypothetical protein NTZ04_02505 [Chloroflexi bacterium]|nr:hypothetical protein [Chloroflexota bacterium]